jgi:hypothetical protein
MSNQVIERPRVGTITIDRPADEREQDFNPEDLTADAPPLFGRCPVCNKPLQPRCKRTNIPTAPPANAGWESRAKCGGCGTIIVYIGDAKWIVWDGKETPEEEADRKMNDMLGF